MLKSKITPEKINIDLIDFVEQEQLAKNPNTPSEILHRLADSPSEGIRVALYQNPNISHQTLLKLAERSEAV